MATHEKKMVKIYLKSVNVCSPMLIGRWPRMVHDREENQSKE